MTLSEAQKDESDENKRLRIVLLTLHVGEQAFTWFYFYTRVTRLNVVNETLHLLVPGNVV